MLSGVGRSLILVRFDTRLRGYITYALLYIDTRLRG